MRSRGKLAGMEPTTKLRTPSRDEIPSLLDEQAASGLSIAAFARERGLTTWKLYTTARKRTRSKPNGKRPRAERESFVPVSIIGSAQAFELDLGARGTLRVPAGFDAEDLRRLLEVVGAC